MTTEQLISARDLGNSACEYLHSVMGLHTQKEDVFVGKSTEPIPESLALKWLGRKIKTNNFPAFVFKIVSSE